MSSAEARFNIALPPRKPEGSLGRTALDGHLDSHTAPELYVMLLVSVKSKAVFQTDTLYSCLLSLVSFSLVSFSLVSLTHTPIVVYIYAS